MALVLIIVLIVLLLGGLPAAPWGTWQHGYGYWPSGVLGIVLLVVVILLVLGRL